MARLSAMCVGILFLHAAGCSCIATKQDWHYQFTNWRRAGAAFNCCYSKAEQKCLGCDFERGFKRGFIDTSMGKDCQVPAVPPPRYWSAKYQCASGQMLVQNWFRGYEHGIIASQSAGYPQFNEVPVSTFAPVLNKTACGMCQSCDPCSCSTSDGAPSVSGVPAYDNAAGISTQPSPRNSELNQVTANRENSSSDFFGERRSADRIPIRSAVDGNELATPPEAPGYWNNGENARTEPPVKPSRPVQLTGNSIDETSAEHQVPSMPNSVGIIGGDGAIRQTLVGPSDKGFLFARPATLASGESSEP
jgi:hypothetical protein